MKVVVGSPNPVKVSAVVDAFSKYFDVDVSSVDVESGIKTRARSRQLVWIVEMDEKIVGCVAIVDARA